MTSASFFSIVVPVLDGGDDFTRCLDALRASACTDWELIVVDDGSTDGSGDVARAAGARVLETGGPLGPASARNQGAEAARGEVLVFVDADCEVHTDALCLARQIFESDQGPDALFGSYDRSPSAPGMVSQFKNLMHHWVHQQAREEASTFWSGLGFVRRAAFASVDGFDAQRYRRASIEDIELGYRLREAGFEIRVAKAVQARHRKRWTLRELIRTDVWLRGVPWTRLLLERAAARRELNLDLRSRASVVLVVVATLALIAAIVVPPLGLGAAAMLVAVAVLNRRLYAFFAAARSPAFLLAAVPLHILYCLYSAFGYAAGGLAHLARL